MRLFQVVCVSLLAVLARTQELQNCSVDAIPLTVGSTEDAGALAASITGCPDGDFAVLWVGNVFVEETIRITGGTSLDITGAGPGATADGGSNTQLFYVDEGSILLLSDMTLANGNASPGDGGAIFVNRSTVSLSGNMSIISNSASDGGAIYAYDSTVSWHGDDTEFISNCADDEGGAIYAYNSTVSWDGDSTEFSNNSAIFGGAIFAWYNLNVSLGDSTKFSYNSAVFGGVLYIGYSVIAWDSDSSWFISNAADYGGAIFAYSSTVSWDGDSTQFNNNSAKSGGAISAYNSTVSWDGDNTKFIFNSARIDGGAIMANFQSTVAWNGRGTEFISNSADLDGGAIHVRSTTVSLNPSTTFRRNFAGENGGALAVIDLDENAEIGPFNGTVLIDNNAGTAGGGIYLSNCGIEIDFIDVTFESNSAGGAGGAIAAFAAGAAVFSRCRFLNNKADGVGGAVETLSGEQEFRSCDFVSNSADIGGALRLGGAAIVSDCSFRSNSATSRGLAVVVVTSANITGSSFDRNEFYCEAGSYREDTQEEDINARFETVCFDCPGWDKCLGCSIERGDITPTCEAPLEHTTAAEPGSTLETLIISRGHWRATNTSDIILACYNEDACSGGVTGADSFCASGYTGPYCAVCETDFSTSPGHTCTRCSSSRRQGLMAATVIAALVVVLAIVMMLKFLLSTKVEEKNIGWFHRRVLRAVPVQALKIIVVVWQILIQFADAASVSYPALYQDFLSVIDFINFDLGSVLAAGCVWPDIDFHDRLVVSTVGPLVVIGFLAMTYQIAVRRNGRHSSDNAVVENIFHKHLTALLLLTFLVYSSVSSMVFQTFACETLDDGIEYLRADYRIHCTDAKHKAFEVYAGIMVFVYPVGIPLLYAMLLFQHRNVLAYAGVDKTTAHPIAGLWESYTPDRFYYEVVECGRRIMLTGVVVFIFPNDAAQIAITILIAFFFFAVFESLSPYESATDTWLSRAGHAIIFLSMFDLLLVKVDVSGERDQSQAAFAGVLVAGHVLMILAIVGEVFGICYASGTKKAAIEASCESPSGLKDRVGSDDMPVFESAPASWKSFIRRESVLEHTGPSRSISGAVVATVGRP